MPRIGVTGTTGKASQEPSSPPLLSRPYSPPPNTPPRAPVTPPLPGGRLSGWSWKGSASPDSARFQGSEADAASSSPGAGAGLPTEPASGSRLAGTPHGTPPGSLSEPCCPVPVLGARALQPAPPAVRGLIGGEYEARGPADSGHKAAGAYLETPAHEGGG